MNFTPIFLKTENELNKILRKQRKHRQRLGILFLSTWDEGSKTLLPFILWIALECLMHLLFLKQLKCLTWCSSKDRGLSRRIIYPACIKSLVCENLLVLGSHLSFFRTFCF